MEILLALQLQLQDTEILPSPLQQLVVTEAHLHQVKRPKVRRRVLFLRLQPSQLTRVYFPVVLQPVWTMLFLLLLKSNL